MAGRSFRALAGINGLRRTAIEQNPEERKLINRAARSIFAKQLGWCIGLILSVIPLTVLFSINAMIHFAGLWQTVAFFGMMIGTTMWVAFLDRSSIAAFATANAIGIIMVAGSALALAYRSEVGDE